MREECDIEGCFCHVTNQPITEVIYGEKSVEERKKRARRGPSLEAYEPRGHGNAIWRRLDLSALDQLADRYPKARRFAARRRV